jgi:cell division protein FtsQ
MKRVKSKRSNKWLARLARPAAGLVALAALILSLIAGSRLFELKDVQVIGASAPLERQIEATIKKSVGQAKLLDIDLPSLRQRIESLPAVKGAWVARALPDAIRVEVIQREPVIPVRRASGAIVWMDAEAVELGEFSELRPGTPPPPIARGFSEGARARAALIEDRDRIAIYKQIQQELSRANMWNLIDEVDLSIKEDAHVRLIKPPVNIRLGNRDFLNRFETALKVLDALKRSDLDTLDRFRVLYARQWVKKLNKLSYIDVARPDQIVLPPPPADAAASDRANPSPRNKNKDRR